jgi:hypothetical protein
MEMKEFYKQAILEAVDLCTDISMLDLVWKLILSECPTRPADSNIVYIENERSKAA